MSGAVPLPAARPWGRAARTGCPCVPGTGGVGMGDPAPAPQRALFRAGVERCGGGGRASRAARIQGRLSGSATHLLRERVCGRWGPALSLWLACPAVGCVPRGWRAADPWGVAFHRCQGRLVSSAVPLPAARRSGRVARTRCPCVPGTAGVGIGDPAPAPQRALLRAGFARCGGGGKASPGGMPCADVRGF